MSTPAPQHDPRPAKPPEAAKAPEGSEPSAAGAAPYVVIAGPTAGGKSALALALARRLRARGTPAELVSADAFQIYRGMDVGTAKAAVEEQREFPHHLVDLTEPHGDSAFTVQNWLSRARGAIEQIRARGATPIVVGGTHLYVKALLEGLFEGPEPDAALRARLQVTPLADLRAELQRVDPDAAARIHTNDARRTIRAVEVFRQTGTPISALQRQWGRGDANDTGPESPAGGRALLVVLDWPVEAINRRINARVRAMFDAQPVGLVEETARLLDAAAVRGPISLQAREAIGTKQLLEVAERLAHARGVLDNTDAAAAAILRGLAGGPLEDVIERVKIDTRRLAKNQRTWLKRLRLWPRTLTLDGPTAATDPAAAASAVATQLNEDGGPPVSTPGD